MNIGAKLNFTFFHHLNIDKINFGAQCFDLDMVIKRPKINLGAKLSSRRTRRKCSSENTLAEQPPLCTLTELKMNLGAKLRCATENEN